jgi:hypothetical protein
MAKSAAERTRAFRERQREALAKASDRSLTVLRRPLSEYLDGTILELDENLDSLGVELRGTDLREEVQHFRSDGLGDRTMSTLERLTGLAGVFLDAAVELHTLINSYKAEEVRDRIAELEGADLADPEARRKAVAELVELHAMRDRLSKEFRRSLPEIAVKGL